MRLRDVFSPEEAQQLARAVRGKTAEGAWPVETRVEKGRSAATERHQPGALGTVRGSLGPISNGSPRVYAYLVEWDDLPGTVAFVHDRDGALVRV